MVTTTSYQEAITVPSSKASLFDVVITAVEDYALGV